MNEGLLQHYVGKTIKTIETDGNDDTLFIEFTDGHNIFIESGVYMESNPWLDITINSFTSPMD